MSRVDPPDGAVATRADAATVEGSVDRPLRVLLVCNRFAPSIGGIQRHVESIARDLARRGHHVEVWTHQLDASDPAFERLDEGLVVRRFGLTIRHPHMLTSFRLAMALARHSCEYDVVHVHGYHDTPALWTALVPRDRLVFTLHYHGASEGKVRNAAHTPYRWLMRPLVRRAAVLAYVSDAERRAASRWFRTTRPTLITSNGVTVVPRCAPDERAAEAATDSIQVLSIGRLDRYKNVHRLIEAATTMRPLPTVHIAGSGPQLSALRSQVDSAGAEAASRIHVMGAVSDEEKMALLSIADVGVSLSDHEAQGISVLEFLASGIPVVASDIAAHRQIADDVGRVVLVDPNDPQAVAAGLLAASRWGRGAPLDVPTWAATTDVVEAGYRLATRGVAPDRTSSARPRPLQSTHQHRRIEAAATGR